MNNDRTTTSDKLELDLNISNNYFPISPMDMPIGVLGGVTVTLPLISGWMRHWK